MKTKIFMLFLAALFLMPCVLRAEEVVIQLMEVITMSPLPGDDPLDDPIHKPLDPFAPELVFPNPVITNTVEVQVVDQSYANRGSNETTETRPAIDYTLELWNENYGLLKTITSSISGEKDVVTLDVSNLHNGIYFLTMKVNNQVVKTNKLILNR